MSRPDVHEATPDRGPPFALVAIPLRRPEVAAFLRDWRVPPRGAVVRVVEQRPPVAVRDAWLDGIAAAAGGTHDLVDRVLGTDPVMAHVGTTTTDRLVPRDFLGDDEFLERNLGGWSPLWFGPLAVVDPTDDPMLAVAERIVDYGSAIPSVGVDAELVRTRLEREFPRGPDHLARGAAALRRARRRNGNPERDLVEDLVAAASGSGPLADDLDPMLAHDELVEHLHRTELARRAAVAGDDREQARSLADRQREVGDRWGIRLLLKGEYLMGRHRRSTVLLAEGVGVVVKQPAPEPLHTIDLAARRVDDLPENWPRPVHGGAMVTPRCAIAQVVASTAVERLDRAFGRTVRFSTALGLSVEPFEPGPTLAALARRRPGELTSERYDQVLLHQLVCEELGVDNPDWHAANFMVTGDGLVHVDWGAARPIDDDDRSPADVRARLDQVRELAWSFQDEALAARVVDLHERATTDDDHVEALRRRARDLVDAA